ncbi:uncharacterized protein MELLADRAFT_117976 [Melampsora larici-populina 98AG31]|uniref:Uncharacterized protein n=1 Tax=Melampsora larici-populina (strain 98AG31 / pathotype 3-4-7) TaxID=747676 RepID=F4S3N5_MELLP|nr:uncharacterized protein MELLADRAFT_117976 [Melampsora larici-populina 98AG31]EGG00703.1 hypothetical protein MELLADRAFT_117976 [Melampsora larici-populina 98AG31]
MSSLQSHTTTTKPSDVPAVEGHMNAPKLLFQKPQPSGSKRAASFSISEDDQKKIKIEPGLPSAVVKKESRIEPSRSVTIVLSSDPPSPIIKVEPHSPARFGDSKGMPIELSSDSSWRDEIRSSQDEKNNAGSDGVSLTQDVKIEPGETLDLAPADSEDPVRAHAKALESFLHHCNVPKDDEMTRTILKRAGVKSWTDLIPSVQFTESSLTTRGMHPSLASYLLSEALERVNNLKEEIDSIQDEDDELKYEQEALDV